MFEFGLFIISDVIEIIANNIINILFIVAIYFTLFWFFVLLEKTETKKKKFKYPEITIIVPCYNEEVALERTIIKLYEADYPKEKFNVICVNDGSTDSSLKILKKLQKKFKFKLIDKKNGGKHTAMNMALKYIKTPFFACLDSDSFIYKNSIKEIVKEFVDEKVGAVMPIIKVQEKENILQKIQHYEYMINFFYKLIFAKLDCIHVVPGPLGFYRTKVIKKLGGFVYGHGTEDLEMALRLQKENYKLVQCQTSFVSTFVPKSVQGYISQRVRWYKGSTNLFFFDYRKLILNKKYGEFGLFFVPLIAISGILLVLGTLSFLSLIIIDIFNYLTFLALINFDIYFLISNFEFSNNILDYDWGRIFNFIVLSSLFFILIHLSLIKNNEKTNIFLTFKYFILLTFYFVFYRILLTYVWLKVFKQVIMGNKVKWERIND